MSLGMLLGGAACSTDVKTAGHAPADERARAKEIVDDSTSVVRDMTSQISTEQREHARCVVVVPSLVSGGLFLGARHGEGVASCRTPTGWSPPAFVTITGGSAGLQAGFESADIVMLVRSDRGLSQLFRSSFELAADTSAAAGPVGRERQAGTDQTLKAEIISYAHARGLFAGVEVSGAAIEQDREAANAMYGGAPDVHTLLEGRVQAPADVADFLLQMRTTFPAMEDARDPG